mgnify:CR=1 FL=1
MNTQNKKIIPKIIALIVVLIIGITSILIITSLNNNDGKAKIQASTVQIERKNGSLEWYALYKVDGKNYATILDGDNSKLSQFGKDILYNINDPNIIWRDNNITTIIISVIIGITILISIFIVLSMITYNPKQLTTGKVVYQYNTSLENHILETAINNNDINKF